MKYRKPNVSKRIRSSLRGQHEPKEQTQKSKYGPVLLASPVQLTVCFKRSNIPAIMLIAALCPRQLLQAKLSGRISSCHPA
jgi:hypothetical protein